MYDHKDIEGKWKNIWDSGIDYGAKQKGNEYCLVEFPYPSGNLHIGHWYAFAVPDIFVRYRRMSGYNVFFPIGFDSFGLPAENAAIRNNVDPREWTYKNIEHMTAQLKSMGNSFDWESAVITSDENYYKWTQWLFGKFFENDIIYKAEAEVQKCPDCKTVLANEQVTSEGHCERCGADVTKVTIPHWFMRIKNYAERLIEDLDIVEWTQNIKNQQINWIGRSYGSKIGFNIFNAGNDTDIENNIEVFTTRADTIFGATYIVLSPESKVFEKIYSHIENKKECDEYKAEAGRIKDIERTNANRDITGVAIQGVYAINRANQKKIPIFLADYVLAGYGTGAVMGVPAHDQRDYRFATKYKLPVVNVIKSKNPTDEIYTGEGELMNSGEFDGHKSTEIREKIVEKVGGEMSTNYAIRDWSISRQRYWGCPMPIVYDPNGKAHVIPEKHLPWTLPEDIDHIPTGEAPLANSTELKARVEKIFGEGWTPEYETLDTFVDSSWYFLRYIDNRNDKEFSSINAQEKWMPVSIYFGGSEHTTVHLLYARFFQKVLYDLGLSTSSEPFSRRLNRGLITNSDGGKMSKSKGTVVDPDAEVEVFGADCVRMYLAFIGPYNIPGNYPWDRNGLVGMRRFLERVYKLQEKLSNESPSKDIEISVNQTIKKVGEDIEGYKFNTAISAMMILVNNLYKLDTVNMEVYKKIITILSPFAPFLMEEIWDRVCESSGSIHLTDWPEYDKDNLHTDTVRIAIQITGKIRGDIVVRIDSDESEIVRRIKEYPQLSKQIEGKQVKIFIANKLISYT